MNATHLANGQGNCNAFSTALLWFQPFVVLRSSRRELDTLPSLPTSAKIKQTVNTDASLSAELAMLLFVGVPKKFACSK